MKITKVHYWKEDMKLTRPYAVTYVMHDSVSNIFVRLDADNGNYGLGSGSPSVYVTGEEMDEDCSSRIPELEESLLNTDVRSFRQTITLLTIRYANQPALLAALDMALHDLFCKSVDISLGKYLGVHCQPLPTSITIGLKNVAETVEEGIEYKERNFNVIKLKIGQSMQEDIERCIKLREAVGHKMLIRVDANQGYTAPEFTEFIEKTKLLNLEFFEQPMKPNALDEMALLSRNIQEVCAADENLHKQKEALDLVKRGRLFGIFNIKIMKSGGITEGLKIASIAEQEHLALMWGCMDESVISISASMNAAYASPATKYLDLDGSLDLASDVATGGFDLREGVLYPLHDRPGLGVELL